MPCLGSAGEHHPPGRALRWKLSFTPAVYSRSLARDTVKGASRAIQRNSLIHMHTRTHTHAHTCSLTHVLPARPPTQLCMQAHMRGHPYTLELSESFWACFRIKPIMALALGVSGPCVCTFEGYPRDIRKKGSQGPTLRNALRSVFS